MRRGTAGADTTGNEFIREEAGFLVNNEELLRIESQIFIQDGDHQHISEAACIDSDAYKFHTR